MNMLYGIEELAMMRVEELRKQGERNRFMSTLPRREGMARRWARRLASILRRKRTAPAVHMPAPVLPRRAKRA